ncbi:MAG: 6,7-dimethyl-8-ribityllumazine synthase [Bdellovibrionaceae bacterium]|nr:6,7-dimethyl-8-ribityllumazine synthase [Pseudobdellovibrionaceae bacterium]
MAKKKKAAPKKKKAPLIRVGVVTARFNTEITGKLRDGAERVIETRNERRLADPKASGANYEMWSVDVPGAIEIPLAVQALFDKGCQGVIALGCVIRGETPHFEYVNQSVERALTRLILDFGRPVGFGVLTVENWAQAEDRVGGKHGHKGEEAAEAVLEMIELTREIAKAKSPAEAGRRKEAQLVPGSAKAKILTRGE